ISVKFSLIDLEAEFDYINARGRSKQDFIEKMIGSFEEVVDSIFDEDSLAFNGNRDKFSHIEHFFTTNFYEYSFEIEYQGDKFEQMSPGKKAFIVLKLILEFSDSKIPVLIDQPEDSLDNRAIYSELTKYIKKTKKNRQIIIVTHNPNIVVSGDAENIIVANQQSDNSPNQNGKKFDYVNGALENRNNDSTSEFILQKYNIREHVCDILEGGEDAFIKRENKYSING
ncbi:TPA: AAA family ATPase, partial [Streptococcus pneumoniae]